MSASTPAPGMARAVGALFALAIGVVTWLVVASALGLPPALVLAGTPFFLLAGYVGILLARRRRWRRLARDLGAAPVPRASPVLGTAERIAHASEPPLAGRAHGRAFTLRQDGGGAWTTLAVRLDDVPRAFALDVSPVEARAVEAAPASGARDVQLGDPAFDRRLWVRATDADRARSALPLPLRPALLGLEPFGRLAVRDGALEYWVPGRRRSAAYWVGAVAVVTQLAPHVEHAARA